MDSTEISLTKYGILWRKVQDMDRKIDHAERNVEHLVDLVQQIKNMLWIGCGGLAILAGIAGFFVGKH